MRTYTRLRSSRGSLDACLEKSPIWPIITGYTSIAAAIGLYKKYVPGCCVLWGLYSTKRSNSSFGDRHLNTKAPASPNDRCYVHADNNGTPFPVFNFLICLFATKRCTKSHRSAEFVARMCEARKSGRGQERGRGAQEGERGVRERTREAREREREGERGREQDITWQLDRHHCACCLLRNTIARTFHLPATSTQDYATSDEAKRNYVTPNPIQTPSENRASSRAVTNAIFPLFRRPLGNSQRLGNPISIS